MLLPDDLAGKRVLDIGCRNGLGAFKIADRVGPSGLVVGTDPSPDRVARACDQAPSQHWAGAEWERYLRFVCCCGSGLRAAGLEPGSFDVVVVNSVLYLEPDLGEALVEISRALAPGGLLYHDAVLAEQVVEPDIARVCRGASNIFGCAPTRGELEAALAAAGFEDVRVSRVAPLEVSPGDGRDDLVGHSFTSAVVEARRG